MRTKMRTTTRRRKNKSFGLFAAILVELGTIVAIVVLAQPTWTRGTVERAVNQASEAVAEPQLPGIFASGPIATPWNIEPSRMARIDHWQTFPNAGLEGPQNDPFLPPTSAGQPAWNSRY